MNIVVVDDDPITTRLIEMHLDKDGLHSLVAHDVPAGLKLIEENEVHAVLLDLNLGNRVSGLDLLRELRRTFSPIELPVIMVTASETDKDILECLRAGANDYISKPVSQEILVARLRAHLKLSQLHRKNLELKEAETLSSVIVTYNHEINNPLTIAIGNLGRPPLADLKDHPQYQRVDKALTRILKIVEEIARLSDANSDREKSEYTEGKTMFNVHKKTGS